MNEINPADNPELWEVVLLLRKTEFDLQEYANYVTNRFAAFDPMDVNKMHVEKIIFDIRTSQSKVEGYIIKGRNNKEVDYGLKLPKLEPGIETETPQEDHKRYS